jgi:hypothetical protein
MLSIRISSLRVCSVCASETKCGVAPSKIKKNKLIFLPPNQENQENPSDRISHAWAPLIFLNRNAVGPIAVLMLPSCLFTQVLRGLRQLNCSSFGFLPVSLPRRTSLTYVKSTLRHWCQGSQSDLLLRLRLHLHSPPSLDTIGNKLCRRVRQRHRPTFQLYSYNQRLKKSVLWSRLSSSSGSGPE